MDTLFRRVQLLSAALFSLSHGANDAQKTMGIIVGLLVASQARLRDETGWLRTFYLPNADHIPFWVEMGAYTAIALGTLFGGWRIVHTMGSRITKLRPVGGCAAETGGRVQHPAGHALRDSREHDAHHYRRDRGRRGDDAPLRCSLGRRRTDRLGVDPHHPGGGHHFGVLSLGPGAHGPALAPAMFS